MTTLCGGNTSSPKPGNAVILGVSAALISEGLAAISPWLLPFAFLLDAFTLNLSTFCGTDPPALPAAADLAITNAIGGVLNPNFGTWATAVSNLVQNWAWTQYCQCNAGGPPVIIYPSPPSGQNFPIAPAANPCSDLKTVGLPVGHTQAVGSGLIPTINTSVLPWTGTQTVTLGSQQFVTSVISGTVPTSMYVNGSVVSGLVGGNSVTIDWIVFDSAGNQLTNAVIMVLTSVSPSIAGTLPIPAGAHHIMMHAVDSNALPTITYSFEVTLFCGPSGGGALAGECCTDPEVLNALAHIETMLKAILNGLPGTIPNYQAAGVHAGLTGSGTITLLDPAIAVEVAITADTSGLRQSNGNPTYLYDRGFITPIAVMGALRTPSRIVYNPQIFQIPAISDQIGYTLANGVTITITELLRK